MSHVSRRNLLGLAALGSVATATNGWAQSAYPWKEESPRDTLRRTAFPNVTLKAHNGKTVKFYDDLIKGKFVTLNFMYINCADGTCPVTTYNLKMLQEHLKHRVGRDMFMYSITVDPKRDSLEMLRNYADVHGVGPGWLFLRAEPQDTEILRRHLGFYDRNPARDADQANHAGMVRFGNEPRQLWGTTSGLASPRAMARAILTADWPGGRPAPAVPSTPSGRG